MSLEDEDTWVEGLDLRPRGPLEIRMSVQAESPRTAALRRDNALRLLAELLELPARERQHRLQERRFHDASLLELLLEMGHSALSDDLQRAVALTSLAVDLGSRLQRHGDLDNLEVLSRAVCLAGTSRRLVGNLAIADATFEQAGRLVVSASERGFYCRSLALLRWDQGRTEEAMALLQQADQRFAEALETREQAVCRALLGLLHLEEGQLVRATSLLVRASLELPSESRPWLAAQTWLALALCFAYRGNRGKARSARQQAWELYGEVKDEYAQLCLGWLEGRGAHVLGDLGAEELLQGVRHQLIGRRLLPEATLITIDLGLVLLLSGRWSEMGGLVDEIATVFAGSSGLDLALGALSPYVEDAAAGRLDATIWSGIAPVLRLAFRLEGVPLQPVPFA